jgi:hypothetical protein
MDPGLGGILGVLGLDPEIKHPGLDKVLGLVWNPSAMQNIHWANGAAKDGAH